MLSGAALPWQVVAAVDVTFLPLAAASMLPPLVATRNRRNIAFPFVLIALALANLALHLDAAGIAPLGTEATRAVLGALLVLLVVMGGRVIPFFTRRGLGNMAPPPARPRLDRACLLLSVAVPLAFASGLADTPRIALAVLFSALFALHTARLALWHDRGLWRVPLLWSLHLAYAWIAIACLGMALWHAGVALGPSLVTHALTVGAMSGLILAMMARVSLGHTGRPLQVPTSIAWAFALIQLATLARVVLPLLTPLGVPGVSLSVVCWSLALLLFLRHYLPILLQPRADSMPG
jgi:uncharacterized protein involved in response to NO